jgi:succinoglycan biosynthesis transport protein ExoP
MDMPANSNYAGTTAASPNGQPPEGGINFDTAMGFVRRRARLIIAGCLLGLAYDVYAYKHAVPQYTASSAVLVNNPRVYAVRDAGDGQSASLDAEAMESQMEIIRSDKIAEMVIAKLRPERIELIAPAGSAREQAQIAQLKGGLTVQRLRQTWVLQISYASTDPKYASQVANAYADAYLADQLNSKYEMAKRGGEWMEGQMEDLKQKALDADLAIQKFKRDHNLVTANGALIDDNRLGDITKQLADVQSESAKMEVRYEHIKTILDQRQTGAVVAESMSNPIIEQLRQKYLDAWKKEVEISVKYGSDHLQAQKLRAEMAESERFMFEELGRIAESYKTELSIMKSRVSGLRDTLKNLVTTTSIDHEILAQLRNLERQMETYKSAHSNMLHRYEQTVQQQTIPQIDARVIAPAVTPSTPKPASWLLMFRGLMGGIALSLGLGFLLELRDRSFRTIAQVQSTLGLDFLGALPHIISPRTGPQEPAGPKEVSHLPAVMRYALDNPKSRFTETLLTMKNAADRAAPAGVKARVIGMSSVLPSEGKTTVSMNFATLLAQLGCKTLLIDADLRNPGLTRGAAAHASHGLVETVLDGKALEELLVYEPVSGLAVLPAANAGRVTHSSNFLQSDGMRALIEQAREKFDYVIVDLPPLSAVVDSRVIAPQIDSFLLVVKWGATARKFVNATLTAEREIREKCLGVIFNDVDISRFKLYTEYGPEYYSDRISSYFREQSAAA